MESAGQLSTQRRRKHSHREQSKPSIDRLSSLPDSVLRRILSSLSTKHSVRTSILARRWRYLWSYVPKLTFVNWENQEIINRVMLLSKSQSINTFALRHKIDCSAYQLETWVTFAITRRVKRLDLYFRSQFASLPRCLFTCRTLVSLRLENCGHIPTSGAVCLPRLEKLYLTCVLYEADESLQYLISGCPVLEELEIDSRGAIAHCKVSSPTIKRLVINLSYSGSRLDINTPAVRYLEINITVLEHIKSGPLDSLVEAEIRLRNDDMEQHDYLYSRSVLEFIGRLCGVSKCLFLELAFSTKIVDLLVSCWTLRFRNLIELELKADYRVLSRMLENADNLEILIFTEFCDEIKGWTKPPQQVPKCLLSHLRIVKLFEIEDEKPVLEIIRYLLRNSKVLNRMEIAYGEYLDSEEKLDMVQKISLFQRGSAACEVAFVAFKL
ncbi:hypothetical protein ABFX02_13G075500 [Erythranthe guttata]